MSGGWEPGHVQADLGDDGGGRDRPDAGYVIQPCRRRRERGQMRLDLLVNGGDVGIDAVDAGQHAGQQEPVMLIEVAVEGFLELGDLGGYPAARQLGTVGEFTGDGIMAVLGGRT